VTVTEARNAVDMNRVPKANVDRLMRAMANKMHEIRRNDPEQWAKLYEEGSAVLARLAAKDRQ